MTPMQLGGRGVAAAAIALPLTLLLVGSGGALLFDETVPYVAMSAPYWILAFWGLCEIGIGVAIWIPYLHRLVGLVVAADAVAQAAANSAAGRRAHAAMYLVIGLMGLTITVLWSSKRVPLPEDQPIQRRAAA